MKAAAITRTIILFFILSLISACSGAGGSSSDSGGGSDRSGSSLVTVSVATGTLEARLNAHEDTLFTRSTAQIKKLITPKSATAAVPSFIYKIAFTISASDMDTITKTVSVSGQSEVTESFSLDNGKDRLFTVEALDSAGAVMYTGSSVVDLDGSDVTLSISMKAADTSAPYVSSTSPVSNEPKASASSPIIITFSETVNLSSMAFSLTTGTGSVPGTLSSSGAVVQFTPSIPLSYSTYYTATIYPGVTDTVGNPMPVAYSWSFTTSAMPDTTPPSVTAISPGNNATNVSLTTTVNVTFSEPVDAASINANSFLLYNVDSSVYVSGTVSYIGTTAIFTPSTQLIAGKKYMPTITTAVRDVSGNYLMTAYSWYFTAGASTTPAIATTYPSNNVSNIASLIVVSATFSTTMDPTTINSSTFTLLDGATVVPGTVSYNSSTKMAVYSPTNLLNYNTTYTATITTGVKSSANINLPSAYTWTFTTETPSASGTLDPNFNVTGVNLIAAWTNAVATSIAIQNDDKTVMAGYTNNGLNDDILLVRLNQDGTLDSTFGSGGKVKTDFAAMNDYAYDVAIQTDGKIVVAGQTFIAASDSSFAVARYNTNGTLDTSFGTGGKVMTAIGGGGTDYKARGLAIQSDGKILVTGGDSTTNNNYFGLVRYNTNGSLDGTFGVGGILTDTNFNGHSVIIQPDSKILVGGQTYDGGNTKYAFALARYTSTGTYDASMGGAGKVLTNFSTCADEMMNMVLLGDGTIVGVGNDSCGPSVALAKYTTTGALDTSFYSAAGKLSYYVAAGNYYGSDIAVQSDGKLVVAAASYSNGSSDFALLRFNSNGFIDSIFNGGATVFTDFGSTMDISYALAIQKDGKIVVAGRGGGNLAVARYWP